MVKVGRYATVGWLFGAAWVACAQGQWQGLQFEQMGPDTIVYPFDGEGPKVRLRVINRGTSLSPSFIGLRARTADGAQCTVFPNGGYLVRMAPGETTFVAALVPARCPGATTACTCSNYVDFTFYREPWTGDPSQYLVRKNLMYHDLGSAQPPLSGPLTISGSLAEFYPEASVSLGTLFCNNWFSLTLAAGTSFAVQAPRRPDWYLLVQARGYRSVLRHVDPDAPSLPVVTLEADTKYPRYWLASTVTTPTGFWAGAVSESESTVVVFPGQENWKRVSRSADSALYASSTIYKYSWAGAKLWEHRPGWEVWGGDMTRNGRFVAYCPNSTVGDFNVTESFRLEVVDGRTGGRMWVKTDAVDPRLYDSKEVRFSPTGAYIAVGNQRGQVILIRREDSSTVWISPSQAGVEDGLGFGQVRGIRFDNEERFLYAGSGDGYLRRIRVSDGNVMWRAFVAGWPFVNGMEFSPDGQYLYIGAKSLDQTKVRLSDGRVMWQRETQGLDAVVSRDGRAVAAYNGIVLDAEDGAVRGLSKFRAATQFGPPAESHYALRLNQSVATLDVDGGIRDFSPPCGIGMDGGSHAQWAYVSPDGRYAIITARDMANPPQTGLAFYRKVEEPPVTVHVLGAKSAVQVRCLSIDAERRLRFMLPAEDGSRVALRVTDPAGRCVFHWSGTPSAMAGISVQSTEALAAGLYLCRWRICPAEGAPRTGRIVAIVR